jgi:hypothetical protein
MTTTTLMARVKQAEGNQRHGDKAPSAGRIMRAGTAVATAGCGPLASTSVDVVHDKTCAVVASKVIRGAREQIAKIIEC